MELLNSLIAFFLYHYSLSNFNHVRDFKYDLYCNRNQSVIFKIHLTPVSQTHEFTSLFDISWKSQIHYKQYVSKNLLMILFFKSYHLIFLFQ